MINLNELMTAIQGVNHTPAINPDSVEITGGYVCDMLSDVMGSAKPGQVWVTIMKHLNVIAVASMTGVPVIVFSKGVTPDANVIDKALEESLCLISSPLDTFEVAGKLHRLLHP